MFFSDVVETLLQKYYSYLSKIVTMILETEIGRYPTSTSVCVASQNLLEVRYSL